MEITKEIRGLDQPSLIEKLLGSNYAFASWRMPNTGKINLIVSVRETIDLQGLSKADAGFGINKFQDNHPITPLCIPADITLSEKGELQVDPRVSDLEVTAFLDEITSASNSKRAKSFDQSVVTTSFEKLVAEAIGEIKNEVFEKVVLSRYEDVQLSDDFSLSDFFIRICKTYPNAFCSLVHLPDEGIWVGASPELLISDDKARFKTTAIAGTKALPNEMPLADIAWTQKEIEEQAFVSRYIINCFKKIRLREFHEHGPKTVRAGGLAHLKTEFEVRYDEVSFDGLADQMLELLHPTSAVCGMPLEAALNFIKSKEGYNRSYYSGFLGPVNFEGSTDLFVNLRCVNIRNGMARFFAGAGLTEDSSPEKEFVETSLKMQTLRRVIQG